uniref:Ig-like domain-containing protein n=1 Tax=Pseudomonas phage Nican01 TaxID=3138540 RepID=A0AAU6W1F3_9CAUD
MASSTENIRMGTCRVLFNGVDLGFTTGGVEVAVATTTHETKVDQFGDTVANEYIMGRTITVTVPLVETTLENMAAIIPGATLVTDNTNPQAPKKNVIVTSGTGLSLLERAKTLTLHPIANAEADTSEDLVIPLAATAGAMNFAYKYDAERVFNCEFKGYPDSETGILFTYGDKSVTVNKA